MLIRLAIGLFLICLPLFIVAKTLLLFTLTFFATIATKGAIFLLLSAFCLLILASIIFFIKYLWRVLSDFFSSSQTEKRHLLFVENETKNAARLFHFQRLQLNYLKELQRKKILEQNNRKQIKLLSHAIEKELKQIKSKISKDIFLQLQLENRLLTLKQNEQALLELHKKIVTIAGKLPC